MEAFLFCERFSWPYRWPSILPLPPSTILYSPFFVLVLSVKCSLSCPKLSNSVANKSAKLFCTYRSATYICTMEINKALENLLKSDTFREKAKEKNNEGGKLRMFVTRYQRGEISTGTAVTLLEQFGYKVEVLPTKSTK